MKFIVVAIYDVASAAFARPAFVVSVGAAMRSFQDEVNRVAPDNEINRHPADFHLYELGVYDDNAGRFEHVGEVPRKLLDGAQALVK